MLLNSKWISLIIKLVYIIGSLFESLKKNKIFTMQMSVTYDVKVIQNY